MTAQTVAIDFDGVIHRYSKGWHDGTIYDEPMPGAIEGIKKLQEKYAVFVFTSRDPLPVCRWLEEWGIRATVDTPSPPSFWSNQGVVLVTNRKLPAVAYVDDRAVVFVDWADVPSQLEPETQEHVIELRHDGWTIKHPLACRPDLFDCPVNRAAEREMGYPPPRQGRFWCGLGQDGGLVIGAARE